MMSNRIPLVLLSILFASAASSATERGSMNAPTERTVYVTVTDAKGTAIGELTAADFVVKEGGKEREIITVAPAQARMRLALAIEDGLVADGAIRLGIFNFVKRVAGAADISLVTIGISNRTVVPFTGDANAVLNAINSLTLNPVRDSNVAEGVLELANQFSGAKADRPVLVVVALSGGQASVSPRNVLEKLGDSGATMHSVTLDSGGSVTPLGSMGDESGREQILGDGPKQSGGRRIEVPNTNAVPKALQQVADELLAQYAITYTLPDGVKPNKRLSVTSKKRGVTLRAPSIIPER